MRIRPCIDIHNGTVKQIVGSTLTDDDKNPDLSKAVENFRSVRGAAYFAELFKAKNLPGGHVINLNRRDTGFFGISKAEVMSALSAYPGGLDAGGGITPDNAKEYIDAGAAHVIVTSFLFRNGRFLLERLSDMVKAVTAGKLIIDLSCKKDGGKYYVYTDRWQTRTDLVVDTSLFERLFAYCGGFLIHGISAEGKRGGADLELVEMLGETAPLTRPITYAGGVGTLSDIASVREAGKGRVDLTIGSALSIYGGDMELDMAVKEAEALS